MQVVENETLNEEQWIAEAKKESTSANLNDIKFFITPSHNCSYLPRKDATTLFVDPRLIITPANYSYMSIIYIALTAKIVTPAFP